MQSQDSHLTAIKGGNSAPVRRKRATGTGKTKKQNFRLPKLTSTYLKAIAFQEGSNSTAQLEKAIALLVDKWAYEHQSIGLIGAVEGLILAECGPDDVPARTPGISDTVYLHTLVNAYNAIRFPGDCED